MPIMISSLRLGGLDESLAEEVGLYDALTVTIDDDMTPAGAAMGGGALQTGSTTGQDNILVLSARADIPLVPAPPKPPAFTSSLTFPIPEPGAEVSAGVLEPCVVDLISTPAAGGPQYGEMPTVIIDQGVREKTFGC